MNPVNEELKARMSAYLAARHGSGESADEGYNYAYLYPGLQKVVQAAGRVIRTQRDEGVIYLMDDRFTRAEVRALMPDWWKLECIRAPRKRPASTSVAG